MEIAQAALTLWAKSGDPFHPLLAHMLDAGAVAWAILEREPARTRALYASDWDLQEEEALRLVAFLVGLHDLGKASPVFQAAWPEGAKRVWDLGLTWDQELVQESWVAHGVLTEIYVEDVLKRQGFPRRVADKVAIALGAHHGFLAQGDELDTGRSHVKMENPLWKEARDYLVERLAAGLRLRLPLRVGREDVSATAVLRVMALASFADWIASDPGFFPYGRDPGKAGYWEEALDLAHRALESLPWPKTRLGEARTFEELFPFSPNALQKGVVQVLQTVPPEPILLLLEAPMGLGKTEAALYAYYVLRQRLDHRGLYLALPTQATANGLFPRVRDFLEKLVAGERWELQLQHGAAPLNPLYAELLERAHPVQVDDDPERAGEGGVAASAWFSAKKRAMLAGHGVGTLDQALLGVLKVKHHFIRLWGLMNRVVVLDEVHAYDTYTSGLLKALLVWLKGLGSSVILMTATLPQGKRQELLRAWLGDEGLGTPLSLPPYPRVCAFSQGRMQGVHVPLEGKRLRLEAAPVAPEELAPFLKGRLPGVVGAIVNTVDRAQNLYLALGEGERVTLEDLLRAMGPGEDQEPWASLREVREEKGQFTVGKRLADGTWVFLLHARFPAEERALREAVALALFGKHGPRPEKAILVATQVAEQSLDLDFDFLYSDLAPIDLLFQRAGRLHRHPRPRPPGLEEPLLAVGGLRGLSQAEDGGPSFSGELHWSRVYEDYVLLSTWFSLRGREELHLPQDLEALLDEVYERPWDAFPRELQARAKRSYEDLIQRQQQEAQTAENLALAKLDRLLSRVDAAALAADLRLDDEEESSRTQRFLTRLGDPSLAVVPVYKRNGEWFLDAEGKRPARLKGELEKDEVLAIWSRAVRLSRYPIPQKLLKQDPPSAWRKSGLLRGLRPLEVGASFSLEKGALAVDLDPELGVVYRQV